MARPKKLPEPQFRPEYTQGITNTMAMGLSAEAWAGHIGITPDVLKKWTSTIPEFARARQIGQLRCQKFWEDLGLQLVTGDLKGNATVWALNMKNRFAWGDKPDPMADDNLKPIQLAYTLPVPDLVQANEDT